MKNYRFFFYAKTVPWRYFVNVLLLIYKDFIFVMGWPATVLLIKYFKGDFLNISIFHCILAKYCPILTTHISLERLYMRLSKNLTFDKLTLKGFIVQGHIWAD